MPTQQLKAANTLPIKDIHIQDSFWSPYIDLVRQVVIPYQWDALNDRIPEAEPSHAIRNLKIAAGDEEGEFYGMVFQDSDVAKWLEAVGYLLETDSDPELEQLADEVIDLIGRAQRADGYLNTYYTLKEPGKEWTNLCECHELYTAGHFIEAAVAYYKSTGKRKILDIVCRFADYIDTVFGPEPGKIQGYDGHQEIELALVKLYRVTGNEAYLRLSQFFLEQRGHGDFYLEEYEKRGKTRHWYNADMINDKKYSQTHLPIRQQDAAEGHAVRAVYMATGIADVAMETGDSSMLDACRKLWHNIVSKRMYITGGIGSMAFGEAFSLDYDLPNDTVYAETCASIGLIFFARRMLQIEPKSEYADVMERALYNTVVAGMAKDGKHFFYVNPLEVWPDACGVNHIYDHVKPVRQGWFGCACCPPNIARLLSSLGEYVYTVQDDTIYTHLYMGGKAKVEVAGQTIVLEQRSEFPWNGHVGFTVQSKSDLEFTLALRVPNWTSGCELFVNGEAVEWEHTVTHGYAMIKRVWAPGDQVIWSMTMPILRMKGHPLLRETIGKAALQRGPLVYCLEEADNGKHLHQIRLLAGEEGKVVSKPALLGGMNVLQMPAYRDSDEQWGSELYRADRAVKQELIEAEYIPYYAWANRGPGEMMVWVRE
ncbi:glycoside hydrolase family 127 protein [Paenibacillus hexagrammi]|uniref:Glycoside hydrolase family 127 protein n=1 Tax=Paenibacillus hexagrammi TaxID=2908839 RepID=A0ABY3SEA6_9BACL|nr:beta-L-arabinofuranosidase domain-containing protein [Paenibacillus sp. YPD9-1]UJF32132.1 glycoside hydrolase family 127 protein [Paenibacillus sp. YPD9-1]